MPMAVDFVERQLVKVDNHLAKEDMDDDILFVSSHDNSLDVAPLLYEFINLQVPLIAPCDGDEEYCDKDMLDKLKELNESDNEDNITHNQFTIASLLEKNKQ
jgi:uncharacterized metal-binding protein YceD (DUF177 family)